MTTNTKTADKHIVSELNFGAKTAKRVGWESWSFRIVGPLQVEVTNESYGYLSDEHQYIVSVEESDKLVVPRECECKADLYNEEYDCKHKVALATVGGPVVLEASVKYPTPKGNPERSNASTLSDKLRADGGATTEGVGGESKPLDAEQPGECDCAELSDDFPCWPCVRDGKRELPNR